MILVCGEALFDVFVEGEDNSGALRLEARPGGSPFNVAIGIARLGGRSALLTGMSGDMLGERLVRILKKEGVSTDYLVRSGRRTTLSLVGLDEAGHPAYVFYGLGSADCSVTVDDLPQIGPEVTGFHFGSYSLVARPVADALAAVADAAGETFVSVDPNVRPTVESDLDIWRSRIADYTKLADLIKVSSEDLGILYPEVSPDRIAADWLTAGVRLVVVTDGGEMVSAWTTAGHVVRVAPAAVNVVDTVGAGDSFQAALLTALADAGNGYPKVAIAGLDAERLEDLLQFAIDAARVTCGRRGADLPHRHELSAM